MKGGEGPMLEGPRREKRTGQNNVRFEDQG